MGVRITFEDESAYDHAIQEAKAEALTDAADEWRAIQRTDDHLLAQWLRTRAHLIRVGQDMNQTTNHEIRRQP